MSSLFLCFLLLGVASSGKVPSLREQPGEQTSLIQGGFGSSGDIREDREIKAAQQLQKIFQENGRQINPGQGSINQQLTQLQQGQVNTDLGAQKLYARGYYPRRQQYSGQDVPNPNLYYRFGYSPFLDYSNGPSYPYGRFPQYDFPYYGYPNYYPYGFYPYNLGPPQYYAPYGSNQREPLLDNRLSYESNRSPSYPDPPDHTPYYQVPRYTPPQRENQQMVPGQSVVNYGSNLRGSERGSSVLQPYFLPSGEFLGTNRQRGQILNGNNTFPSSERELQYRGPQVLQIGIRGNPDGNYFQQMPNNPSPATPISDDGRGFQQVQPGEVTNVEANGLRMGNGNPYDGGTFQPADADRGSVNTNSAIGQDINRAPSDVFASTGKQNQGLADNRRNSAGADINRQGIPLYNDRFPLDRQGRPFNPAGVTQGGSVNRGMINSDRTNRGPLDITGGVALTPEQIQQLFGQPIGPSRVGNSNRQLLTGEGPSSGDDGSRGRYRKGNERDPLPPSRPNPPRFNDGTVTSTKSGSQSQGQPLLDSNGQVQLELLDEIRRITAGIPAAKSR